MGADSRDRKSCLRTVHVCTVIFASTSKEPSVSWTGFVTGFEVNVCLFWMYHCAQIMSYPSYIYLEFL